MNSLTFQTPLLLLILGLCLIFHTTNSLSTVSISSTDNQTATLLICAINQQSDLNCSTFPTGAAISITPRNYTYSGIVGGEGFVCGVIISTVPTTSVMVCWRFSSSYSNPDYRRIYRGPILNEVEAGSTHICGIVNSTGRIECWQWKGSSSVTNQLNTGVDSLNFSSIAVGDDDFVCGVDRLGQITCAAAAGGSMMSTPSGNYNVVKAGSGFACGIAAVNGSLICWGDMRKVSGGIPNGEFTSLALGEKRGCGVRVNATVACWGDEDGSFSIPDDLKNVSFTAIEGKGSVFCGVLSTNYSLVCWGSSVFGKNSYSLVFDNVLPGSCSLTKDCKCGTLPGSGQFCRDGKVVCQLCNPGQQPTNNTVQQPPASSPQSPPDENSNDGKFWSKKNVIFLVVGITGSVMIVVSVVICYVIIRNSKSGSSSRVQDSGPLDEEAAAAQTTNPHHRNKNQQQLQLQRGGSLHRETTYPHRNKNQRQLQRGGSLHRHQSVRTQGRAVLVKKLSHIASFGNQRLEEFPLQILLQATDNFSLPHKIGHGSFGSVYRATLNGTRLVAIKRGELLVSTNMTTTMKTMIKKKNEDRDTAFLAELESLSHLNHRNLVRLLGFCEESGERILVYEYMSNGTLHDHLHKYKYNKTRTRDQLSSTSSSSSSSPLTTWRGRIKAALDAARGIEYLHVYSVPPVIHRDIKSSNILLDTDWTAKVSDFGLSLTTTSSSFSSTSAAAAAAAPVMSEQSSSSNGGGGHLSLLAAGTLGYIDPEYYRRHQLTTRSDVYSFGVVLLEILSGQKAIHLNEDGLPRNVVDYVVPYIDRDEIHRVVDVGMPPPTPYEIEAVGDVGRMAGECVSLESKDRPDMTLVVACLERAWKMMNDEDDHFVVSADQLLSSESEF